AVCLGCLVLTGCGPRKWAQDAADANAGAEAFQSADQPGADPAKLLEIARGVVAHVRSVLANLPSLPKPTHSPAQIQADPAAYHTAGVEAQEKPAPYAAPPPPAPADPTFADRLRAWGDRFAHWGLMVGGIGGALSLLGWVYGLFGWTFLGWVGRLLFAPFLTPVFRLAASLGGASAAIGAALLWLADWWWAIVLVAVAVGVAVALFHLKDLRRIGERVRT